MMATRLRLCDEDREKFGGPEWVTWDENELDDLSHKALAGFETEMQTSIVYLLQVDKVARTISWTTARVWLARKMAGIKTVPFAEFDIKPRKVLEEIVAEEDDAAPPSSSESSEDDPSAQDSL